MEKAAQWRASWFVVFAKYYNEGEEDEMDGACSTNGEKRYAYRLLVGKLEERRPLERPRHR
jgi:hypothetical protein